MSFDRSKAIAVLTGLVSLALGIAYLILVQVLDSRGGMTPAPVGAIAGNISVIYSQLQLQDILTL